MTDSRINLPFIIVAIDGGAASGKSTSSLALSERFDLFHVDTGSFYRAITAEMMQRGVKPTDLPRVREAITSLQLGTRISGRTAVMEIDGRVAGDEIRKAAVNDQVSHFAAIPDIRGVLLGYQRGQVDVARKHGFKGLIMEGRDIGSVVFPNADFRFFLFADPAERERRREKQGGQDSIAERDRLDTSRKASPLTRADGATAIDTTHLSLDEVVNQLAREIQERAPSAAKAPEGKR